ncbi:hypothetical protein Nepgr_010926 [Nepenthes gracilis]|uniref:Serine protease inhibitor, Kazal-type family protein n=1 Tax=Nepenthes gracilis TaxID=150966 RepID=A0AAD3SE57_NEPGR|nr:hypothetical protein Nepgr_010926 [Nepenthes gracilis]
MAFQPLAMFSSSSFLNFAFSLFLFSLLFLSSTVKSEYDSAALRLPSDGVNGEIEDGDSRVCPVSSKPGSCPVKCFRPDPVCGEDGVTYWCGCADAHCAGKRVAKIGFCEVGNGGSGPLSGQALLLVHIVWLIVLGFSVLCGIL